MNKIFPEEMIKMSVEHHFSRYSTRSVVVYLLILILVTGSFISLFFIRMDIIITGRGIIRSSTEPVSILSLVSGEVFRVNLSENKMVSRGDTLIWLRHDKFSVRMEYLQKLIEENQDFIRDTEHLINEQYANLRTELYRTAYWEFRQKLEESDIIIDHYSKLLERTQRLYLRQVIPFTELEETEFQLKRYTEERNMIIRMKRNEWLKQKTDYEQLNKRYSDELSGIMKELNNYFIQSPGTGHLTQSLGIMVGSFITAGQHVALLSPNESLVVETLIPPHDIGYLHTGMEVIYQIDAYNYNTWGMASGELTDISTDVYMLETMPFFKVRSTINETHLTLKNGYMGELKKGFTTSVRFKVAKRTLAQMLLEKADRWLNPGVINQ